MYYDLELTNDDYYGGFKGRLLAFEGHLPFDKIDSWFNLSYLWNET